DPSGIATLAIIPAEGNYTIESIAVNDLGEIFFTGLFHGPQLTIGPFALTNQNYNPTGGTGVVYLAKLNPDGSALWARGTQRSVESVFPNLPSEIALDGQGNVYIGGRFHSQSITFTDVTLTKPLGNTPNFFMVQ